MRRAEEKNEFRAYELIIGVVYLPVLDELFVAEKGRERRWTDAKSMSPT